MAISVVIAVGMGWAASRGSWFADDLDLLVYGRKGFSPSVLFAPANDHVVPGLRFVIAVFAQFGGFSYVFTVLWRSVVLALNILLMGALLNRLVGASRWALVGAGIYGLSPLMVPAFMQLSAAVNDVHAQLFGLVLLHATLDWFRDRRWTALVVAPVALALVLSFWLKAGLIVLTAAVLGWIVGRARTRERVLDLVLWSAALAAPLVAYAALVLPRRRGGTAQWPGWDVEGRLLVTSVRESVLAPFAGGPWLWTDTPPYGYAAAPPAAVVLGALTVLTLVALGLRYHRDALLLWGSALVFVVATVGIVSVGRYAQFGDSLTRQYHYWSDLGIPLVLATVLTLDRMVPWPMDASPDRPRSHRSARGLPVTRPLAIALVVLWTAGALVSHVGFARLWGQNPAKAYFATVSTELERSGSPPNVWDTPVPTTIAPLINDHRRVGELLAMAGMGVRLQQPDSQPRVFDDSGRLRPADFRAWARGVVPPDCRMRLTGAGSLVVPLDHALPPANWYVKLAYLANPDARVTAELVDLRTGRSARLASHVEAWPSGLLTAYLNDARTAQGVPATALRLTSSADNTSVCVGTTEVGLVEPAR